MLCTLLQRLIGSGEWVSLCIFLISLILACTVAVKKLDIVKPLLILGMGLAVADSFLLLSYCQIESQNCGFNDKVATIFASIMTMTQMVTLNANYKDIFIHASKSNLFLLLVSIFSILMPVIWGSVLLTLFESFANWFMYQLFRRFVPVYFFSELHERSLELAKSILLRNNKKCLCIFCKVSEDIPSGLKEEAKSLRCLLFKKSETKFIKNPKNAQTFFELSENQDDNLANSLCLIKSYAEKYEDADFSSVRIFLYSEQEEAPVVLNSIDKKGLPASIINRDRFIANDLLFNHPLFNEISEDKKSSVLIVGAGKSGLELLKTSLWCGQLGSDYSLEITVIDKHADSVKKSLQLECPEFFNDEYKISFIQADVTYPEFIEKLDSNMFAPNYICVCLGNDELNIRTAQNLRSYFKRKNIESDEQPFIAAMVRNDSKNGILSENAPNFITFGGNSLVYSYSVIDSNLERLALNVHQVYMNGEKEKRKILKDYYKNEYNIKSDRANALHIRYKLFLLGYDIHPLSENERFKQPSEFSLLEKDIKKLAQVEHERWNAYTRSEGWCRAELSQIAATKNNSSKIPDAKLHACLCSWDELDEVSEYFGIDYKKYDEDFVREIPKILGLSEKDSNITGTRYVLSKREYEHKNSTI